MIAALEGIKLKGNPESSSHANNLIPALLSSAFLVNLHVAEHMQAATLPLSRKGQGMNVVMSAAISDIEVVQQTIRNDRTSADEAFSKTFSKVTELASKLNMEITNKWIGTRQQHRGNIPEETSEEYFRKLMFIPFIDFTLAQPDQ